jgi:hypothetical protein
MEPNGAQIERTQQRIKRIALGRAGRSRAGRRDAATDAMRDREESKLVRIGHDVKLAAGVAARKHVGEPRRRFACEAEIAEKNRPIRTVKNEAAGGFDSKTPRAWLRRRRVRLLFERIGFETIENAVCQLSAGKNDGAATGEHDLLHAAKPLALALPALEPEWRHRDNGGFISLVDECDYAA